MAIKLYNFAFGPYPQRLNIVDCVAMATLQYAADFYAVPIPAECVKLQNWFDRFSKRASAVQPFYPQAKLSRGLGLMERTGISL